MGLFRGFDKKGVGADSQAKEAIAVGNFSACHALVFTSFGILGSLAALLCFRFCSQNHGTFCCFLFVVTKTYVYFVSKLRVNSCG